MGNSIRSTRVDVVRERNGIPTVVDLQGRRYILDLTSKQGRSMHDKATKLEQQRAAREKSSDANN